MTTEVQPPTGEKIAAEVEREMQQHLYRLRHATLAPAEYHIYLHPDDYAHIELVVPRIAQDVQMCLNALVERLNKRKWRLSERQRAPIEIPAGGWAIYIKPAANNEVGPGELGIHSRLSVPSAARFGSGAGTVLINETLVSSSERRTRVLQDGPPQATEPPRPEPPRPEPPASEPSASGPPPLPRPSSSSGPRLGYTDDTGSHVFRIERDLIKIGRGGAAHWVDLTVACGPQVSREHCRIRRQAGRFFLQDVSGWGTFVDGQPVPKFVEADSSTEREIGHGSSIRLADAVTLQLLLE